MVRSHLAKGQLQNSVLTTSIINVSVIVVIVVVAIGLSGSQTPSSSWSKVSNMCEPARAIFKLFRLGLHIQYIIKHIMTS